jgi:hypothetical protein
MKVRTDAVERTERRNAPRKRLALIQDKQLKLSMFVQHCRPRFVTKSVKSPVFPQTTMVPAILNVPQRAAA